MTTAVPRTNPHMARYCRVCMATKDPPELISLFQIHSSEDDVIANMIIDCTEVMVSDDDNLPQNICSECLVRLNQAYQLRKQCQRSDEAFRAMLLEGEHEQGSKRASEGKSFKSTEYLFLSALLPAHYQILQSKEHYHVVEIVGFRCCGCDGVFVTEQELKLHSLEAHTNKEKVASNRCETCGACFSSRTELADHEKDLKYQYNACRMCHLMLETEDAMLEHLRDVHQLDLERLSSETKVEPALVHSPDSNQMEVDEFGEEDEEEIEYLDEDADYHEYLDYASKEQNMEFNIAKTSTGDKTIHLIDLPEEEFIESVEEFLGFKVFHIRGERCCECLQLFANTDSLRSHCDHEHAIHRKEAEPVKYRCNVCFKRFDSGRNLTEHRKIAESKSIYQCELCCLILLDEINFLRHILATANHDTIINTIVLDGKFEETIATNSKCCGCNRVFKNKNDLLAHARENHKRNRSLDDTKDDFECEICHAKFTEANLLDLHKLDTQNAPWYRCCSQGCDYKTIHRRAVLEHVSTLISHGRKQSKTCSKNDQTTSRFACCVGRCYEVFNSSESLESHAETAHELLRIQHTQDRVTDSVVCSICLKGFNTQKAYDKHRSLDKSRSTHVCLKCGAQYVSKSNLLQHERSKCGKVATFQCTHCDKAFMTMGGLRNHQNLHSSKRSFVCDLCERAFRRKGILKDHLNTVHSTVRLFRCTLCPKSFSNRNVFQSHQATHTKEKPFQCRHCDKRYFKTSDRTLHENQVHLGIRPFKCHYCSASFIRDRERRLHERTHTKAKLYTCELCSEGYNKFAEYKSHRLTEHGLETLRDLGPAVMAALHGGQSDDGGAEQNECKLEIEVYEDDSNEIV